MVNYKRVVCEVAVLVTLVAAVASTPIDNENHYDQRQNGSENYRLNIDGVVIAVAPADSLLAAASEFDVSDLLDLYDGSDMHKPKPPASSEVLLKPPVSTEGLLKPPTLAEPKPEEGKPDEAKPVKPADTPLSDVSLSSENTPQKKDVTTKKHENAQRLKNKIAHLLLPFLRRNKHH